MLVTAFVAQLNVLRGAAFAVALLGFYLPPLPHSFSSSLLLSLSLCPSSFALLYLSRCSVNDAKFSARIGRVLWPWLTRNFAAAAVAAATDSSTWQQQLQQQQQKKQQEQQ